MQKSAEKAHLLTLYQELNRNYFENAIYLNDIRAVRFFRDVFFEGVSYGLFQSTPEGDRVYLNKDLIAPEIIKVCPWGVEVVLYHELCHAHLCQNLYPVRFGNYTCREHGAEFWKLMLCHPRAGDWDRAMDSLYPIVKKRTALSAQKFQQKNPEKWNRMVRRWKETWNFS